MAEDLSWVPAGVDPGKASIARVYDYCLGGTHNLQADRDAARAMLAVDPNVRAIARANRAFLGRAVRFLLDAGIRQFLDIGSGIPTEGNVHEVAQREAPGTRIVYVDIDPVAVAHSRALLAGHENAAITHADMRNPEQVLGSAEVRRLLDLQQPVGVLLASVLHFLADAEDPWRLVSTLRDALAPGSFLVISHAASDNMSAAERDALTKMYRGRVATQGRLRSRAEIERFFEGLELVDPGLTLITEWRPDAPAPAAGDPARIWFFAGAGRKPPLPLTGEKAVWRRI